jgi:Ca2+-binding RTX toxin-like protein
MSTEKKPLDASDLSQVTGGSQVVGTDNPDYINTGHGSDLVYGQGGNDQIFTNGGNDQVQAGSGDDYVDAGAGDDLVFGQEGNDTVIAGEGNDQVQGGAGHDLLIGDGGQDQLFGQDGNDTLYGGFRDGAADHLEGGTGDDTFVWSPGDGNDAFFGQQGKDMLELVNVTEDQLRAGLQLFNGGLEMLVNSAGTVVFVDSNGQPASFSGTLTIGNERITFQDVERIRLAN